MRAVALAIGAAGLTTTALAGEIVIEVANVAPGGGTVYAALCEGALRKASCRGGDARPGTAETVRLTIPNVAPGTYASVVFQDTNGNGALDKTVIGLPKEPYAISNTPSGLPTFKKAAFAVDGQRATVKVRLRRPNWK